MYNYCFITDKKYINSTLCILSKIKKRSIFVLCLDQISSDIINQFDEKIKTFKISDILEKSQDQLLRDTRDKRGYVFTLKSFFLDYLFTVSKEENYFIYLDSDLFFFSDNQDFEIEIERVNSSIILTPHNFDDKNIFRELYGKYNAGIVIFKNNNEGKKVLNWWKKKCFNYCDSKFNAALNIYADQKYLDNFFIISNDVKILYHPGINCAPWNLNNYKLKLGNEKNIIYVNEKKLILYHFHSFKFLLNKFYIHNLKDYNVNENDIIKIIYKTYIKNLIKINNFNAEDISLLNFFQNLKFFLKSVLKKNISII